MLENITYEDLLAAAQADPAHADYLALRMALTRSDAYAPYAQHSDAVFALRAALPAHNLPEVITACEDLLAFNYLDIEAHMAADYAHTLSDAPDRAAYHRTFARGLIQSVLASGTGRDFSSAWIVIDTAEEYVVLRVLGLVPGGQRLVNHAGHWFDLQVGRPRDGGEPVERYFNIDLPYTWLQARQHDHGDHDTPGGTGDPES